AVDLRALLAEEAAHTGARVEGPAREVEGDPGLLRRLVRNLLENAARHGGGEVEARTTAEGFEVADRGPGVRPEDRELIFEPFHRPAGHSEGADGGVGLGLWLVREIATRHGGSVRCEAREGGGARFVVRLPRREPRGAV
ncbi:MAG: sensor histidine kinase, partial [Myxococcales bacterium]|nr:sensor histidine kinase [Myxococcales bacterium]